MYVVFYIKFIFTIRLSIVSTLVFNFAIYADIVD